MEAKARHFGCLRAIGLFAAIRWIAEGIGGAEERAGTMGVFRCPQGRGYSEACLLPNSLGGHSEGGEVSRFFDETRGRERRERESNPRIGVLQTPALPLGYPAVKLRGV